MCKILHINDYSCNDFTETDLIGFRKLMKIKLLTNFLGPKQMLLWKISCTNEDV